MTDRSDPWPSDAERAGEGSLRPRKLEEFVGQARVREQLGIVLESARRRGLAPDHLLFSGPPRAGQDQPGRDRGRRAGRLPGHPPGRRWSGPATWLPSSPASSRATSLFVDEIHRLPRAVEEVLYPAMEDFQIDVVLGKGPGA